MHDHTQHSDSLPPLTDLPRRLFEQSWRLFRDATDNGAQGQEQLLAELARHAERAFDELCAQQRLWQQSLETLLGSRSQAAPHQSAAELYWPWLALAGGAGPQPLQQHRQQLDELAAAAHALSASQADYLGILSEIVRESLEGMREALEGEPVPERSLQELYTLWMGVGERAYEQAVDTERYAEAFGRVTNAYGRFLECVQGFYDGAAAWLGLPSRQEFLDMQRRLQELRRSARSQQDQTRQMDALRQEVAELRAEIAALHGAERDSRKRRA